MTFSVIIPVYNCAPWLRECLGSVVASCQLLVASRQLLVAGERGEGVEVICVDDGSTDGSAEILQGFKVSEVSEFLRFKVIRQENRGEGAARNRGLEAATGDWICFLDADDLYAPEMLTEAARLIRENPDSDIVCVRAAVFNDGDDPRKAVLSKAGPLTGVFSTGVYRRSKFGDVRFKDYFVGADRVYAASCVYRANRIVEGKAVGYLYRQRATSISHVAMTPRKALDSFLHVAEMLRIAAAVGHALDPASRRQLVAQVLEAGASNWRRLPRTDRRAVESRWRRCVAELRKEGLLTPWGNFVAAVLRLLPFGATVSLLCVLPHRLKKAGLHR